MHHYVDSKFLFFVVLAWSKHIMSNVTNLSLTRMTTFKTHSFGNSTHDKDKIHIIKDTYLVYGIFVVSSRQ